MRSRNEDEAISRVERSPSFTGNESKTINRWEKPCSTFRRDTREDE